MLNIVCLGLDLRFVVEAELRVSLTESRNSYFKYVSFKV